MRTRVYLIVTFMKFFFFFLVKSKFFVVLELMGRRRLWRGNLVQHDQRKYIKYTVVRCFSVFEQFSKTQEGTKPFSLFRPDITNLEEEEEGTSKILIHRWGSLFTRVCWSVGYCSFILGWCQISIAVLRSCQRVCIRKINHLKSNCCHGQLRKNGGEGDKTCIECVLIL